MRNDGASRGRQYTLAIRFRPWTRTAATVQTVAEAGQTLGPIPIDARPDRRTRRPRVADRRAAAGRSRPASTGCTGSSGPTTRRRRHGQLRRGAARRHRRPRRELRAVRHAASGGRRQRRNRPHRLQNLGSRDLEEGGRASATTGTIWMARRRSGTAARPSPLDQGHPPDARRRRRSRPSSAPRTSRAATRWSGTCARATAPGQSTQPGLARATTCCKCWSPSAARAPPRPVDLSKSFNTVGIASGGAKAGGFDGRGATLPAEMLPPDGTAEVDGNPIRWRASPARRSTPPATTRPRPARARPPTMPFRSCTRPSGATERRLLHRARRSTCPAASTKPSTCWRRPAAARPSREFGLYYGGNSRRRPSPAAGLKCRR